MAKDLKPGKPARGSSTGRPIMVLLDLLGHRWALRILWELRGAPLTFRALQAACGGLSPSVLQTRIDELRAAGILSHGEASGYTLTDDGKSLLKALLPLEIWAQGWADRSARDS